MSRFIKLTPQISDHNINTISYYDVLPAKVRAIKPAATTLKSPLNKKKGRSWGGGGSMEKVCVSTKSKPRHPLNEDS